MPAPLSKESGGVFAPPPCRRPVQKGLAEQLEHRLVRLVGDRECRDFQLLLGLLGEQVGALLVLVGRDQVAGAGLQRLIIAVVNVCRVEMVDALVPNVSVWSARRDRGVDAGDRVGERALSDWNDVCAVPLIADRPSPASVVGHAGDGQRAGAVALKSIVRLSPLSRLMPL